MKNEPLEPFDDEEEIIILIHDTRNQNTNMHKKHQPACKTLKTFPKKGIFSRINAL